MKKSTLSLTACLLLSSAVFADAPFLEKDEASTEGAFEYSKVNTIKPDFDVKIGYVKSDTEEANFSDTSGVKFDLKYKICDKGVKYLGNVLYIGLNGEISNGDQLKNTNTLPSYDYKIGSLGVYSGYYTEGNRFLYGVYAGATKIETGYNSVQIELTSPIYGLSVEDTVQLGKSDIWIGLKGSYSYIDKTTITVDNVDLQNKESFNLYTVSVPVELHTSKNYSFFVEYEYQGIDGAGAYLTTQKAILGLNGNF